MSYFVPSIWNKSPKIITVLWKEDRSLFVIKLLTQYQRAVWTIWNLKNQFREVIWLAGRRQILVCASYRFWKQLYHSWWCEWCLCEHITCLTPSFRLSWLIVVPFMLCFFMVVNYFTGFWGVVGLRRVFTFNVCCTEYKNYSL